jgi:uncharacterized protein with PQ loop repeat
MLHIAIILTSFLLILLMGCLLCLNQHVKRAPLEPPLISNTVPVIGHLVAFIYYEIEYFSLQR